MHLPKMDDTYELQALLEQQGLELFQAVNKLRIVEAENKQLKQSIQALALENSRALEVPKKRKLSKHVIDRWKYYHENKAHVAIRYDLTTADWRAIKAKCDELFADNR